MDLSQLGMDMSGWTALSRLKIDFNPETSPPVSTAFSDQFFCRVRGHQAAGMHDIITIEG